MIFTFQRLDNKVADQTGRQRRLVCAFVVEMTRPITHISVTACFNTLARSIYDMRKAWSVSVYIVSTEVCSAKNKPK